MTAAFIFGVLVGFYFGMLLTCMAVVAKGKS